MIPRWFTDVQTIMGSTRSLACSCSELFTKLIFSGLQGWDDVFYLLIAADLIAALVSLFLCIGYQFCH